MSQALPFPVAADDDRFFTAPLAAADPEIAAAVAPTSCAASRTTSS